MRRVLLLTRHAWYSGGSRKLIFFPRRTLDVRRWWRERSMMKGLSFPPTKRVTVVSHQRQPIHWGKRSLLSAAFKQSYAEATGRWVHSCFYECVRWRLGLRTCSCLTIAGSCMLQRCVFSSIIISMWMIRQLQRTASHSPAMQVDPFLSACRPTRW